MYLLIGVNVDVTRQLTEEDNRRLVCLSRDKARELAAALNKWADGGELPGTIKRTFDVDGYNAHVNSDGVDVGCQHFDNDAIDELYNASLEAQS